MWQSLENTSEVGLSETDRTPVFAFEDYFYKEYSGSIDFEASLAQFIDLYIDNRQSIITETKKAVDPLIEHNHDFGRKEMNYINYYVEISNLNSYEFKIHFVFMHGYVYYEVSYRFLSPENYLITKIERILTN
ncbi:hypothetical protein ACM46_07150 [Chryseobacterium angstadtii]|uniref:Uncharacterized protein n=2 Tax=Chryseobacterium angstadtii TaxID=558151 RepID=A0A0J7IGW6_9FLAO|nr:hypothetical protein ACM46_07150 [Chryseobacterium angstadtii]